MAPLRNRSHRVQNDQDQMIEGLPIRNWRRLESNIGAPAEEQSIVTHSRWPELPMPRDSALLSDMSRQLLRIARLPKVSKPASQAEDDDKENADEEDTKKSEDRQGFMVRKWSQMSKEWSQPDREYLAKRRKGLPSQEGYNMLYGPLGVSRAFRKLKVRRYDADGFPHIYEVMAPVGMPVEGEIVEDAQTAPVPVEPPAAPGTVIDGVGVVNEQGIVVAQATPTPNRRKPPPPPRKKKKAPFGKHSKKKIVTEFGPDGLPIHPPGPSDGLTPAEGTEQGDTPMADAQDHDDEGESGEEGEDMEEEEDEHEEGEISSSATPVRSQSAEVTPVGPAEPLPAISTPTYNPSSLRSEVKFEIDVAAPLDDPFVEPPRPVEAEVATQDIVMDDPAELSAPSDLSILKPESESLIVDALPDTVPAVIVEDKSVISSITPDESFLTSIPDAMQPESTTISTDPIISAEVISVIEAPAIPISSTEGVSDSALSTANAPSMDLEDAAIVEALVIVEEAQPPNAIHDDITTQEATEIAQTIEPSDPVENETPEAAKPAEAVDTIKPEPIEPIKPSEPIEPIEVITPIAPKEDVELMESETQTVIEAPEKAEMQETAEPPDDIPKPAEPIEPALETVKEEEEAPLKADLKMAGQEVPPAFGEDEDMVEKDQAANTENEDLGTMATSE